MSPISSNFFQNYRIMVEHGSSVSKIKEILKNSKSVKKSDEILDDLFSSIKVEVKSSTSDDDGDDESNSDDSEGERKKRKKSKKKKKKKDKKLKKKKKRHKHSSESESELEKERSRSKRGKREETVDDSFWGGSKPYDENVGKELRIKSRERREPEYNDERRPVDLGRVARPYPDSRDMAYPPEPRSEYRREEWRREEYDREGVSGRRRDEYERERGGGGRRREERGGRERKEYEREEKSSRGATVTREMSVASVASTVGGGKDGFWDTKWDAMKLDEKIQDEERRGQYYLNTKKRFKQTMGEDEGEGTPSLSPSPERESKEQKKKKKKEKEREEECDELKGIRKLADLQDNKVEGDGKVKGAVPDSKDYEYDRVTRMYKKKEEIVEKERVKKGFPEPEELKQPVDEEEEERIRQAAIEQDKNELCIKADLSNVDEIPLDVLLKAKRRVDSKHYHDPNIDASQVLNPRKAKLLNPSKAAMDKAFPRNEVKQRSEVVKKIAEMHR